jgi:hypothetical protein
MVKKPPSSRAAARNAARKAARDAAVAADAHRQSQAQGGGHNGSGGTEAAALEVGEPITPCAAEHGSFDVIAHLHTFRGHARAVVALALHPATSGAARLGAARPRGGYSS